MRRAVLLACALALALPGAASAHSLVRPGGEVVSYLSVDATSLNDLVVRTDGNRIEFRDTAVDGGMDPGPCTPGDLDAQSYIIQVFCPLGPVKRVRVDLGDREDTATVSLSIPVTVLGGTGADSITTGAAADEIVGGEGADELDSGAGDDRIAARDGTPDVIRCGSGNDAVDADAADQVAADCEAVTSTEGPEPPSYDVPGAPRLAVGAAVVQRASEGGAVKVYATASEPAGVSASGFLDAAGLQLPIERLARQNVSVGGGGVVLTYRLRGREWREASRSLRRDRRVRVRLAVVATDPGGLSRSRDAPVVRLVRSGDRAFASLARHPTPTDQDGDEVEDVNDNCVFVKNGSQTNTDHDAEGDACDADDDNDGVPDATDNCRVVVNPSQADADGDGYGDDCPPTDSDEDTIIDQDDNCDFADNPDQADLDGDDKGDACDTDRDGDRIDDQYDNCPTVYNLEPTDTDGDGFVNDQADADGDGIGTACDPDEATVVVPAPTPAPVTPLQATARTARRQKASVVGAGPIVALRCNVACAARSVLRTPSGRILATGSARLAGAGSTYAFTRFRSKVRRAVKAVLETTFTPAGGEPAVVRLSVRLTP